MASEKYIHKKLYFMKPKSKRYMHFTDPYSYQYVNNINLTTTDTHNKYNILYTFNSNRLLRAILVRSPYFACVPLQSRHFVMYQTYRVTQNHDT
jgi:hypothetical protein